MHKHLVDLLQCVGWLVRSSFIGTVGHNIRWENCQNELFRPKKGPNVKSSAGGGGQNLALRFPNNIFPNCIFEVFPAYASSKLCEFI